MGVNFDELARIFIEKKLIVGVSKVECRKELAPGQIGWRRCPLTLAGGTHRYPAVSAQAGSSIGLGNSHYRSSPVAWGGGGDLH